MGSRLRPPTEKNPSPTSNARTIGSSKPPPADDLIVLFDVEVILYFRNTLGLTGDGDGSFPLLFAPNVTAQPDHAMVIGVDVDTRHAARVFRRELRLDLGGDHRILHERLGMGTVAIPIVGCISEDGKHQRRCDQTGQGYFLTHMDIL